MLKKTILFIFLGILLISFASAQLPSLGTFKQGQAVDIVQVCSDATYINITSISYPNSSRAVQGVEMIESNGEYHYQFTDTSQIGRYDVRGISDGCEKTFATYFEVKQEGRMNLILLLGLFALILLGVAYLFESEYISFISGCLFIVLGIYTMIYGIDTLPDMYTRTIAFTSIGLGFIFTIASAFRAIESE